MKRSTLRTLLLFLVSATLTSCGGGGAGGAQVSGIEGSGVAPKRITSSGEITATGSIFVNEVEYDLAAATITVDGDPAGESDIDVGAIVIVEGELGVNGTTGSAKRVTAGIAVAGRVDTISDAAQHLTILGQSVVVDTNTRFANAVDGQLMGKIDIGDDVEVAGFADSTGTLFARRIAPRMASTPLRVTGYAEQVDVAHHRFVINGETIDYSNATLTGLSSHDLAGASVRVDGDDVDAQGALLATNVVYRPPKLPGDTGDFAALQGWVTRFASSKDFDVDGHPVVTTSATTVEGPIGDVISVVRLDAFIEVRGRLLADGVVEASQILTNNLISLDSVISFKTEQSILANLWWPGSSFCNTTTTAVTIDGVPARADAIKVGDVATIYEHHPDQWGSDENCEVIAVEHNVRGPLESEPGDSLSFYVMGQRVWLDPARVNLPWLNIESGFDALKSLQVGDIVEVSGHTTAEGDILATGIHAGSATGPYRVIGLAREVDTSLEQFELGNLTVNYRDAELSGFANGGPAERDRVLVIAGAAPSAGVLQADIVRYTGGAPRGQTMNWLRYNGLITRYVSADDLDLEGRRLAPRQPQWDLAGSWNVRCDLTKLHANLAPMYMIGLGWGAGELPHYGLTHCPPGRRLDSRGPNEIDGGTIEISGPVQAVDLDRRVVRVGGIDLMLQPATRLTDFQASSDPTGEVTTPISLDDLQMGDRVKVVSEVVAGLAGAIAVWRGDGAVDSEVDARIVAPLESVEEPDLVLAGGIRVPVSPNTAMNVVNDCVQLSAEQFWASAAGTFPQIEVIGAMNGSELQTVSITAVVGRGSRPYDCPVPDSVDAGPDQTVTAGTAVTLTGSLLVDWGDCWWTECGWGWNQVGGPAVDLDPPHDSNVATFVAPAVSQPVDLVFRFSSWQDYGPWGEDTVTIHVVLAAQ